MSQGRPSGADDVRVVVVDDETHVADLYAEYLKREYDVEVAYGGTEALEIIDDGVDVVLLDRRMPRLSGGEVLEKLRDRGYEGRVVMVTAVEPDFEVVDMPFDDYVTKPVDRDTVLGTVEEQRLLATYDSRLDEYVRKRKKLEVLEDRKSRAELKESDRYGALRVVTESLREDLEEMIAEHDLEPDRRVSAVTHLGEDGDAVADGG